MPKFIKSHSNYRLSTRHQTVNGGEILERDISTVGGVNSFATGQDTIYQSGNFVIVVNNSSTASRHIVRQGWVSNTSSGDTWTAEVLSEETSDINGSVESRILIKNDFTDFRSFACYGSLYDLVRNTISTIIRTFPYEIYTMDVDDPEQQTAVDYIDSDAASGMTLYEVSNPGGIDIYTKEIDGGTKEPGLGYFANGGYNNYSVISRNADSGQDIIGWESKPIGNFKCPVAGKIFAEVKIYLSPRWIVTIYACWDEKKNVRYVTNKKGDRLHIRPKQELSYYDNFIDNLDLFGKCLMGVFSGRKYTATFETIDDIDGFSTKTVETMVFPVNVGGYNIGSDKLDMETYVQRLSQIGLRYDEGFTDNAYRMLTHDSIKNLDWTKDFNGEPNDSDENQYINTGEKVKAIVRIMGYVFDNNKTYISSISDTNTITYDNKSNLADYFLTDSLETDGWVVNPTYTYTLTEYDESGNTVDDYSDESQKGNVYTRHFGENVTEIIKPYDELTYEGERKAYIEGCDGKKEIPYTGDLYYYDEDLNVVRNVLMNYDDSTEMTVPDINNEFMKRLRINSRNILRKKGTIEGIESMLSLFGMVSDRWLTLTREQNSQSSGLTSIDADFSIDEYTILTPPIEDKFDNSKGDFKIDWYNSCKTISYPTASYMNGEYIPYQGLPVSYKEVDENTRKLYPSFYSDGIYDGDMYYQMNGGWLNYTDYQFDANDKIIENNNHTVHHETLRNALQVKNLRELVSQPASEVLPNVIYYVNDMNPVYAVIDGQLYEMTPENDTYYFDSFIYGGAVSIGEKLYNGVLTVSDPNGPSGMTSYDLSIYEDGTPVRIYFTGDKNIPFSISGETLDSEETVKPDTEYIYTSGTTGESIDEYSKYFVISESGDTSLIGDMGWEQIRFDDERYKMIDGVADNYQGNNPHSGNYAYDNGYEYISRYKKLFKYALDNDYFNDSCFGNKPEAYSEIEKYGFELPEESDYLSGLTKDSKVHVFADRQSSGATGNIIAYGEPGNTLSGITEYSGSTDDNETSQIINTKVVDLTFYLKSTGGLYSKNVQEEIKYLQCKVMPYVEQMIPSSVIMNVYYKQKT